MSLTLLGKPGEVQGDRERKSRAVTTLYLERSICVMEVVGYVSLQICQEVILEI